MVQDVPGHTECESNPFDPSAFDLHDCIVNCIASGMMMDTILSDLR